MLWNNKVVWSEGMLLQQQHLQQHDRYLHTLLDLRARPLRAHGWGLSRLTIDTALLRLGKLALTECEGILPDGTPLSLPQQDDLPLPLDIPPGTLDARVVLALPLARPGVAETGDGDYARFRIADSEVADSHSDAAEQALMQVGKLRLRLAFADQVAGAYAVVGIAHILERRTDNLVLLNPEFIAPCLDFRVAPSLAQFGDELCGLLQQRAMALATRLSQSGANGVAEIADFLLLQLINRHKPLCGHLARAGGVHPETLFCELLQLAGELASFQPSRLAPSFPDYRHDDLAQSFHPLIQGLRHALSLVVDARALAIPLEARGHGVFVGVVADPRLFAEGAAFVLAVKAELPSEVLISRFPAQVKIGPVERIGDLVNLQLPAIGLRPLSAVPRQLPLHAGYRYFALDSTHALWLQLATSAGIALHIAGDFPGLALELWAIRNNPGGME